MAACCLVESLIGPLKGCLIVLLCSKMNVKATSKMGMLRLETIPVALARIEIETKEIPALMERKITVEGNINHSYFRSTFLLWLISYEQ